MPDGSMDPSNSAAMQACGAALISDQPRQRTGFRPAGSPSPGAIERLGLDHDLNQQTLMQSTCSAPSILGRIALVHEPVENGLQQVAAAPPARRLSTPSISSHLPFNEMIAPRVYIQRVQNLMRIPCATTFSTDPGPANWMRALLQINLDWSEYADPFRIVETNLFPRIPTGGRCASKRRGGFGVVRSDE